MNRQEIISKALKRAISHGYDADALDKYEMSPDSVAALIIKEKLGSINILIFDRMFAKSLWGDLPRHMVSDENYAKELLNWEYNLQQMVIAPDPIQYLGENI